MGTCPRHGDAAEALTISCQSCGVQIASGDLRDTYGRSFVVKSLDKIKRAHLCENTRSASPVFPQLGLEPNHAGLASQSLFLLEELLQSKTQWHSKTFSSSKNDLKEFRAHSNVFQSSQNKTSSTQTQNNLPNSSQNNMFLRHGSNNIQNTKNPQKNEKSTSKLFHAQTGSIWFQIGSYVVPTWFLRFSIVQMVVPTNLKVTYLFSCTCNVPR